jgi:hypothetical protein
MDDARSAVINHVTTTTGLVSFLMTRTMKIAAAIRATVAASGSTPARAGLVTSNRNPSLATPSLFAGSAGIAANSLQAINPKKFGTLSLRGRM